MKLMQYRRDSDDKLYLYIQDTDGGIWTKFNQHKLHQPDYVISSNSGFRTSQYLLKLGYKFLKLNE